MWKEEVGQAEEVRVGLRGALLRCREQERVLEGQPKERDCNKGEQRRQPPFFALRM